MAAGVCAGTNAWLTSMVRSVFSDSPNWAVVTGIRRMTSSFVVSGYVSSTWSPMRTVTVCPGTRSGRPSKWRKNVASRRGLRSASVATFLVHCHSTCAFSYFSR